MVALPPGVDATGRWHIIVIGAGIGGLTAALSLQRQGFRVSVYERASELSEFGAGLLVTPNAMHALDFLGVGQSIADCSNPSTEHEYRHYKAAEVLQRRAQPPSTGPYRVPACFKCIGQTYIASSAPPCSPMIPAPFT